MQGAWSLCSKRPSFWVSLPFTRGRPCGCPFLCRVRALEEEFLACRQTIAQLQDQMQDTEQRLARAAKVLEGVSVEGDKWRSEAALLEASRDTLLSDALLATGDRLQILLAETPPKRKADSETREGERLLSLEWLSGYVAYCGAFTFEYRKELNRLWLAACREEGLRVREEFSLAEMLSSPTELGQWKNEGLPPDAASVENAILILNAAKCPLVVDPQGQAMRWLTSRQGEGNALKELSAEDSTFYLALREAVTTGRPTLVVLTEGSREASVERILALAVSVAHSADSREIAELSWWRP